MVLDVASKDATDENVSKNVDNEKVNKSSAEQTESIGKYFIL